MTYLIDYSLGDRVTARFGGQRADAKIEEIVIAADGPAYRVLAGLDVQLLWDEREIVLGGTVEDTTLCRSVDGGSAWTLQHKFDFDDDWVYQIVVLADGSVLAAVEDGVDGAGEAWKSTDQGQTWALAYDGLDEAVYSMIQASTGDVFAGTSGNGEIWRSQDGGASWALVGEPGSTVRCLVEAANGYLVAGTQGADFYLSTDGGATWAWTDWAAGELWVQVLLRLDDGDLLAATGRGGEIWRSQDHGVSWAQIAAIAGEQLPQRMVQLADGAVLCGGYTTVYRSANKGLTWAEVLDVGEDFGDFALTDDGRVLASMGTRLYSSSDGEAWSEIQPTAPPTGGFYCLAWIGSPEE